MNAHIRNGLFLGLGCGCVAKSRCPGRSHPDFTPDDDSQGEGIQNNSDHQLPAYRAFCFHGFNLLLWQPGCLLKNLTWSSNKPMVLGHMLTNCRETE
jgi:hypothetical protein